MLTLEIGCLNLSSEHLLNVTGPTMTHHIVKLLVKSTAFLALTCTFIKHLILSRPCVHILEDGTAQEPDMHTYNAT